MSDLSTNNGDNGDGRLAIEPIEIQEEMERSFLDYAMSVITARALPDARDGLKPVHRRILWGMLDVGARPDRPWMKCARVVGEVMGKYHPHGSQAIYDALVRMVQDFSLRQPLISGHGNFGSPDFGPAAERYCVIGDTLVRTPDATKRIADLAPITPNSEVDLDLKVLNRRGDPVKAVKLFHSGAHPTLRLRTREGFELTGTGNHPVLCLTAPMGVPMLVWKMLAEIEPGDRVVIDRHLPGEQGALSDDDRRLAVLTGAFVAEGYVSENRAGFNNTDEAFFDEVVAAYDRVVGGPRYTYHRTIKSGSRLFELDIQRLDALRDSPLVELIGVRSGDKFVPSFVWNANLAFKRAFLQALFEGDGSCTLASRRSIKLSYSTYSRRLAREVQLLLLEFGVVAKLVPSAKGETRLTMNNRREARLFASQVGFLAAKQDRLERFLAEIPLTSRAFSADAIPFVSDYIRSAAGRGGKKWLGKYNLDRVERWERDEELILARINDPECRKVVEDIVDHGYYYATVASVSPVGHHPVYSVRVDSADHSFLANGFVNHNTECRLAPISMHMLDGIDEDTVNFVDNYSGEFQQPEVVPSRFPNLLVNGSQGIAVGMATNIPPHNLGEVIDATIHLIDHPDAIADDLMRFVTGPDFPTGGQIMGRSGILDAYRTGRGSIKLRARAEIEEGKRNDRIVVTEMPYQTSIVATAARIKDLVNGRGIEGIANANDESSGGTTRLVIELKRDAPALVVLNNLYKHTPLQTNFAVNMVALVDGVPRTLNLVQALQHYVAHQVEVIRRRSEHRLARARDRAHIVEGLLRALDMIDAIIEAIRGSDDRGAARDALVAEPFEFSEVQANHILDMTLSRLTRLGRSELEGEIAKLRQTIGELEAILGDEALLRSVIKTELAEIKEKYHNPRRSEIALDPGELDIEDLIHDEELVVTHSATGYVKTVAADAFRTQGRGGKGVAGAKLRAEDYVTHILHTTAHAYLLFFSNLGRVYRLKAHEIPKKERTARGTAIINLLALQPGERIQAIIDTRDYETNRFLFFATKKGQVKKSKFNEYDSSLRAGLIAINLRDGDELVKVIPTNGDDDVFLVSRSGMTVRFSEHEVRAMGRAAAGVRGMKLKAGDEVVSCDVARDEATILMVTDAGYGKRTKLEHFTRKSRGIQGVMGIKLTARRGFVVAAFMVGIDDEILVINSGGTMARIAVRGISSQGPYATGVRVVSLEPGQTVVAVAPVLSVDDD